MISVVPSLFPNLVSHTSEATVQGEGQKIARLRDFRLVGCRAPKSPFALALHGKSWVGLFTAAPAFPRGKAPSPRAVWAALQLRSRTLPGKALSCELAGRQENSPPCCLSVFPLSFPSKQPPAANIQAAAIWQLSENPSPVIAA